MKRLAVLLCVALIALVFSGTTTTAMAQATCFNCVVECDEGTHKDVTGAPSLIGNMHGSCVPGDCGQGGHTVYGGGDTTPLPFEVTKAAIAGGDVALVSLLLEQDQVRISTSRNALQILDRRGTVVFHKALQPGQAGRLQQALTAIQERRLQVR